MNISTILVSSISTKLFQIPYKGYYKLYIEEENGYSGGIDILDHGTSGNIITENVDFRGFISFSRYIDTTVDNGNFTFDNIRMYNITKVGDYFYIKLLSGTNINVTFRCVEKQLTNQILVGPAGDFTLLKSAVDWFKGYATQNTKILLDGGSHLINDTITVSKNLELCIEGISYNTCILQAITGLENKPMFDIKSNCNINRFTAIGLPTSNFINFTVSETYCEFQDFHVDNFYIGFNDIIGVSFFCLNFVISNCCNTGVAINYSTITLEEQSIDLEIGNFENCPIGINLLKTGTSKQSFFLSSLIFKQVNSTDIAIKYNGITYLYVILANILNCSYNYIGNFTSGFDFTLQRDADIEVSGNIGIENKYPQASVSIIDNLPTAGTATTITTADIYQKVSDFNANDYIAYSCKFGMSNNQLTYYSSHINDYILLLSGNLSSSSNNRVITLALRRPVLNILPITGDGTKVTVTTTTPHNLFTNMYIQVTGFIPTSYNTTSIQKITYISDLSFSYLSTGTGTITKTGNIDNILSGITVRTATANQPYTFSTNTYIRDLSLNEIIEIWITSTTTSDVITIQDMNLLIKT